MKPAHDFAQANLGRRDVGEWNDTIAKSKSEIADAWNTAMRKLGYKYEWRGRIWATKAALKAAGGVA